MQTYRLRFERWRRGLGQSGGKFVPHFRDFEAANRRAALKEATRIWNEIVADSVSVRFVQLVEVVGWAPPKTSPVHAELRLCDDRTRLLAHHPLRTPPAHAAGRAKAGYRRALCLRPRAAH